MTYKELLNLVTFKEVEPHILLWFYQTTYEGVVTH